MKLFLNYLITIVLFSMSIPFAAIFTPIILLYKWVKWYYNEMDAIHMEIKNI